MRLATSTRHLPNYRRCHIESGIKRETLDSVVGDRYPLGMSDARELATDQDIDAVDLAWLEASLEEYRALLQYLRDH